jgi:small multidrug resistance pump
MNWVYLGAAILFEVGGTTMLKLSNGFAKLQWAIPALALYAVSFFALSLALRRIAIGVAYAIWSGIGIVLLAGIGAVYFQETLSWEKLFFIALILVGVVGLNLAGGH